MEKKEQGILLLYLHALNQPKFQHYHYKKKSTVKALAEKVRNLLPDESDHILEKDKIKDFQDFSFEIISHRGNITNSSKNEFSLQSKECLHIGIAHLVSRFACNTRVIVDASSNPPVSNVKSL